MKIQSDIGISVGSDYKQLHQGQHFESQAALICPMIGFFFCILCAARLLSKCCMMFDQMTYKNVYRYTIQFKQSDLLPDQRVWCSL